MLKCCRSATKLCLHLPCHICESCSGSCISISYPRGSQSSIAYAPTAAAVFLQVMEAVEIAFVERFGPYAGWAHNTLFIAELASQQVQLALTHSFRVYF